MGEASVDGMYTIRILLMTEGGRDDVQRLDTLHGAAMTSALGTLTYEVTGRIARITLNRPERGNGITREMPRELAACVERANLDPDVHVIALAGHGKGFCGGYDLVVSAERRDPAALSVADAPPGSPLDPAVLLANHTPGATWDPTVDYAM